MEKISLNIRISTSFFFSFILFLALQLFLLTHFRDLSLNSQPNPVIRQIKVIFSEYLWNKIDFYHHMWEFSGRSSFQETGKIYLVRFITTLNPEFTRAYALGSYFLYRHLNRKEAGRKFLIEGLTKNPESYELWRELTFYNFFVDRDKKKAFSSGKNALNFVPSTDISNDDIIFLRILAVSSFDIGKYEESLEYYKLLSNYVKLNENDKDNINNILEALNGQKKD